MTIKAYIGYGNESHGVPYGFSPKGYAGAGVLECVVTLG